MDLISSDVRYFELGARIETVADVRLAWMPGLADVPAACVVLGADSWSLGKDEVKALEALEARVAEIGGSRVRLYVQPDASTVLARTLLRRGYTSRFEQGLILTRRIPGAEAVTLQRIVDEDDWMLKEILHRESPDTPDGHATAPERWVELERRKTAPQGLVPWLIRVGERVAGTAGTMEHGPLLRLKNILVHRGLRRRGIASAAVAAFGLVAEEQGRTLGFFGVEGTPGAAVYRACGMTPVARWVEWLGPPIGAQRPTEERT